jgi:hypothetical protein
MPVSDLIFSENPPRRVFIVRGGRRRQGAARAKEYRGKAADNHPRISIFYDKSKVL